MENKSKTNSLVTVGILTLVFAGAYGVLRALPDAQCGFLHYEEIVNADGEVEFCATTHAAFLDLTRLRYPVKINLRAADAPGTDQPLEQNQEADVLLELQTEGGMGIEPYELAVTHTKKMHVMLIDPSLEDYHHVHPEPEGVSGKYRFRFTPKRGGAYQVFSEVVPLRTRSQVIATDKIAVGGAASEMTFSRQTAHETGGLRFELHGVPERMRTGVNHRFSLEVRRAEGGGPVVLEEIMGAKGHMVAFDAARKGFAHMHPVDSIVSARAGLGGGANTDAGLDFLFNVPNPGWYRVFAQVQVDGREVFGRFDLKVE